jgi:tRNA pseudouridine38-40 synthase
VRTIRLIVEYDGTDFSGWQRQDNGPTIQGHLEAALAQLLQHEVRLHGASRTDAGVHARGQVAAFDTERTIPTRGIRRGLNSLLPRTIAVRDASDAPAGFHPRYLATGKHYRYLVLARPDRSPRLLTRAWHRPLPLNLDAARAGAAQLVGEHDFSAFRAVGCVAKHAIRRLDRIDIGYLEPEVVAFDIEGNAFLRNMVRILVGTLVDVAEATLAAAQVADILASKARVKAGQTAPAHGLELMAVRYEGTRPDAR